MPSLSTKPKLQYYFVCEDIRQEVGNKSTFIGVFDNPVLRITDPPVTMPKLCFMLVFTGMKPGQEFHISLRDPDNLPLAQMTGAVPETVKVTKHIKISPTMKMNLMFRNAELSKEGIYRLITVFGKHEELAVEFEVTKEESSK